MVNSREVEDTSYSLPLFIVYILGRNDDMFYSLDKLLRYKICHVTYFTIYL